MCFHCLNIIMKEFYQNLSVLLAKLRSLENVEAISENTFINAKDINYPTENVAVIMAGSPASGKSTIIKEQLLVDGKKINSDDFIDVYITQLKNQLKNASEEEKQRLLKPFNGKLPDKNNPKHVTLLYDILVKDKNFASKMRDLFLSPQKGSSVLQNLIIDTTSRDTDLLIKWIDILKEIGYYVIILYVITKLETALNRNKNKDRNRVVDDKYLIHTYKQIHDIFPTIIQDGTLHNCDELWIIFSEDAKQDKSIKEKYSGTAFKMYKKGNVFVIPNDIRAKLYNMINS